jgi:tripartite-type tricarboxylate transporter receptor subunit TctC
MNAEIEKIIANPDIAAKMEGLGLEHTPNTPAQFADFNRSELAKWAKIVKDGNIKVE